jgi:hypothetical protein
MLRPRLTARPERFVADDLNFPKVGLPPCPSEKKGTNGTGLCAARPFSRPRVRAERRETAGLPAHSPGIHCRDRLRAGGSGIRTLGPPWENLRLTRLLRSTSPAFPLQERDRLPRERDRGFESPFLRQRQDVRTGYIGNGTYLRHGVTTLCRRGCRGVAGFSVRDR